MRLASGHRIGSYEVLGPLGAGGMGEVYKARDTKLNRDVALKILPDAVAADPERLVRFRREAQVLASLNHPNIAQIYDSSGDTPAGVAFLVMELVPGRTLAEILDAEGALATETAVSIASQIADALEAAHEQGIIHRDLKPANVKRRDDDVVKLLDFGLARAMDPPGARADDAAANASSPTVLSPATTQHGVILGTAGYMSPEQAKGRVADRRADIWAFGVVLYEMLTGRRLFAGETVAEVIAAVLKGTPSLDALPPEAPPALRHLIARCLERDPKLRLRDIGEARIALRTAMDPTHPLNRIAASASAVSSSRPRTSVATRATVAAGALALAGLAAFVAWRAKPEGATVPVRRFELPAVLGGSQISISPDGSRVAFMRKGHLYMHTLRTASTIDLGTLPPASDSVFWSPDGQTIGYGAEASMRTMPATGGVPFTVCKVPASGRIVDATWLPDGTILFAVWRDGIYKVAATGGTPEVRLAIDPKTEIDFHSVVPLPDGRLMVTTHRRGEDDVSADLVDGSRRTPLANDPDIDPGAFLPPNHVLFRRLRTNPGVWTAPFDGRSLDLTKAVLVEAGAEEFDAASDGTIVSSLPAKEQRELAWVSRSGATSSLPGSAFEPANSMVALSPDAHRAALSVRLPDGKDEVVVRDLATGADTRLPSPRASTGVTTGALVTWTPAGRLLYPAGGVETLKIFDWPADGSPGGRDLVSGFVGRMTPDRGGLVFIQDVRGKMRLFRTPLAPDGAAGVVEPLFHGDDEPSVRYFDLSPDGHLLAYSTTDPATGQLNIWVATYPDLRERRQITSAGGTFPHFSHDGRELFYVSGTRTGSLTRGQLQVVSIKTSPLTAGVPTVLFIEGEGAAGGDRALGLTTFDAAPDGRLLMTRRVPPEPGNEARVVLLQNWMEAIRK